jgi:hypothetical protein
VALSFTNLQLITAVVQGTEQGLLGNATTLPFFNGMPLYLYLYLGTVMQLANLEVYLFVFVSVCG